MIVRDGEPVLGRCLEGVSLFADELIVVDTGSADTTKKIAARYTDQIYDYIWSDDFAAARNESYRYATGDYIMWVDADDVIDEENAAKLNDLKRALAGAVPAGAPESIEMLYDIPENGCMVYHSRIVRRDANPVWQGRLHESIPLRGPAMRTDITIYHRKIHSRDYAQNIRIIRKMLLDDAWMNFRLKANCWLDCYMAGETALADRLFRECKSEAESGTGTDWESCLLIADVLRNLKEYNAALEWYKLALLLSESGSTDAAFLAYQQLVKCCFQLGRRSEAQRYNEKALALRPNSKSVRLNRMALANGIDPVKAGNGDCP
jgi:glycosyltransferase involved in cell wall biosynthesis